jgi:hypothetical protein
MWVVVPTLVTRLLYFLQVMDAIEGGRLSAAVLQSDISEHNIALLTGNFGDDTCAYLSLQVRVDFRAAPVACPVRSSSHLCLHAVDVNVLDFEEAGMPELEDAHVLRLLLEDIYCVCLAMMWFDSAAGWIGYRYLIAY